MYSVPDWTQSTDNLILMRNLIIYFLLPGFLSVVLYGCANKAMGPTGGPKDVTPPKVVRSVPLNGSLNFDKKEIQIVFDENISVEKPGELIVISPPQITPPEIKGNARVVTVKFENDLRDSTTYTVNFGNSIVDLNEKNPLKDFRFSFSTGNAIDTMRVSGHLINAEDLNPVSGVIVGIYAENSDSLFFSEPFLRIGKTDENGHFTIDNCKPGRYKVYALGDVSNDYIYQPGESTAFLDSVIVPSAIQAQMQDTIWKDSVTVDSIRTYMGTRFLPDDLVLQYFKDSKKRQYFIKAERKQPQMFSLFFNAKADKLPEIKPLNFDWENKVLLQKNATLDTLNFWLLDSTLIKTDTLSFQMTYQKTDSLFRLVGQTDTVNVIARRALTPSLKGKKKHEVEMPFLNLTTNLSGGSFDVYSPVLINFEAPLDSLDPSKFRLEQKVDTIYKPVKTEIVPADSSRMLYRISYKWEPESSYTFYIDSAAVRSVYGVINDKYKSDFKVKSLDEYSSVKIVQAKPNPKVVFQVLDTNDKVIATKKSESGATLIEYLRPGDLYLRAFIDDNGNGIWDAGDINLRRQPEQVYYYPKKLTLKANWEFEETWDLTEKPLLEQKPKELRKDASKKKTN